MVKMFGSLHEKCPLFLSDLNEAWSISAVFSKTTEIWTFMKICQVGDELFHADRHDEANSRFSQFCERA